jgi:hypothetical protein
MKEATEASVEGRRGLPNHSLSSFSNHSLDPQLRQAVGIEGLSFHHVLRITTGNFPQNDFVSLKWDVILEQTWELIEGVASGVTHSASSGDSADGVSTFDFIASFTLRTTDLLCFPQILITAYGVDFLGRAYVAGYGQVHLPFHEGKTNMRVQLSRPESSSAVIRVFGALFGKNPEYVDPVRTLLKGYGRKYTTVAPAGWVDLQFETIAGGLSANGFSKSSD